MISHAIGIVKESPGRKMRGCKMEIIRYNENKMYNGKVFSVEGRGKQ
jgi:hypothetical protein